MDGLIKTKQNKKRSLLAFLSLEKVPPDLCLSGSLPEISKWISPSFECFSSYRPCAGPWSDYVWIKSRVWASYSSQALPNIHPVVFKGRIMRTYIFSCRKSVLLVFGLISEMVVLYVVAVSMCPWDNMSSGSSYSASLIQTPYYVTFKFTFLNYWLGWPFFIMYF